MHPVVSKASRLILAGDIESAEKALVEIAEDEGDHALVQVLDQIAPKDLISILREFDSSKESVVSLLVTPEQFARAIVHEKKFGEPNHERLQAIVNSVVHSDPDEAVHYIARLVESHEGCNVLGDYFEDYIEQFFSFTLEGTFQIETYPDLPEEASYLLWLIREIEARERELFGSSGEDIPAPVLNRTEVADRDWMETAWVLRYELPEGFEFVFNVLRNRVLKQIEAAAPVRKTQAVDAASAQAGGDEEESAI